MLSCSVGLVPGHGYSTSQSRRVVIQALRDAGYERTIGIAMVSKRADSDCSLGWRVESPGAEVFGLNHLSWCRRAWLDGEDRLPRAIADERFVREMQSLFEPELVRQIGMHCNEYLYYYYYAEKALEAIRAEGMTRGEEIVLLNQLLIEQLEEIDAERNPDQALRTFFGYERRRLYLHTMRMVA
jgi:6-phospho-beta-glucosidase